MLYNIVVVFAICWHESAMGTPKFYSSFMPSVSSILHTHTQNKFILRLHIYPEEEQIKMNNSVAECGALEYTNLSLILGFFSSGCMTLD